MELFEWSKALNCAKPSGEVVVYEPGRKCLGGRGLGRSLASERGRKKCAGAKLAGLNFVPGRPVNHRDHAAKTGLGAGG